MNMLNKKLINIILVIVLVASIFLKISNFSKGNLLFFIPSTLIVFSIFMLLAINAEEFDRRTEKVIWLGLHKSPKADKGRVKWFRYTGYLGSLLTGFALIIILILFYTS